MSRPHNRHTQHHHEQHAAPADSSEFYSDSEEYVRNNDDSDVDSVDYNVSNSKHSRYQTVNNLWSVVDHNQHQQHHHHTNNNNTNATADPKQVMAACSQEFAAKRHAKPSSLFKTEVDRSVYTPIGDPSEFSEASNYDNIPPGFNVDEAVDYDNDTASTSAVQNPFELPAFPFSHKQIELHAYFAQARKFKMVIVGDAQVGKTTWREYVTASEQTTAADGTVAPNRFVKRAYVPTITTDFETFNCWSVDVNNSDSVVERIRSPRTEPPEWNQVNASAKYVPYTLQLWELAGNTRYAVMATTLFTDATIVLIMLDATNKDTIKSMTGWLQEIDFRCSRHASRLVIMVCLNKIKSQSPPAVTKQLVMAHLETWPRTQAVHSIHYFETDFVFNPQDAVKLFRFITRDVIERQYLRIDTTSGTSATSLSPTASTPADSNTGANASSASPMLPELTDEEVRAVETAKKQSQGYCRRCTLV
jgi:GTPase SAR1 family protein